MALSEISLTAGMRANLFNLQNTGSLMELTQNRLASGKKVNSALDDPINFFAARGHMQRASDLAGRKDEMNGGIQTLKASDQGIEAILDLISSAKSLAQAALAADTTTEADTLMTQYNGVLTQIDDLAADSGYKGINLLNGTTETLTVKFDESGTSSLTVTGFDASSTGLGVTTAAGWQDGSAVDSTAIGADITELDAATSTLRTEAKKLANNLSTITIRQDFTEKMINTLQEGADKLTLADMNEEGANMLALETRQALATTSLALASQAAQSVLKLF